ncbi:metal-binding protein [Piscirickettsia salmonis]|uniref:GTP cyclohydrolase 1 type 2 homolog n=1 Tax=Piscirickettsia salmonis TaxID=1238 RepID=A0A1L6TDV5_PISSA|nr:Nif3-like dinuclear metal center hexameric protein [Piscirickettsia salmonis]AKP74588.1 metal-binding protein [Piscirickettsia salmonis LF-89 = ATCC VR-1361]ALB23590.1 metal-binding protein [Piscirickettsia salmonis]ALY03457.1 metal-binding protein [Piscirickettsia salmonis]AMA43022.1 metal-binding protein [Piscirickettsia salmonis]AOS35491.1 metal-binding protein [Piscirickettsia salmonis]
MIGLFELVDYLNDLLEVKLFKDYAPNGLQVEGKKQIKRLITGVTATQALIDAAIDEHADAILVHHGFFWKSESPCVTGIKYQRLKKLLENDISLIAYHLPLDGHEKYGNNVMLAERLGLEITGSLPVSMKPAIGNIGQLKKAMQIEAFSGLLHQHLLREPIVVTAGDHAIKTVAWCTGAAESFIEAAATLQADAYVTGEISEPVVHLARELGVHFFAAGHHATERYGVQALGQHVQNHYGIEHLFIDIDSPA